MAKTKSTISDVDLLKHKALQVRLTRKKLNRNKMDKALGDELSKLKNVLDAGAVRVNKSLFSKSATDEYMKVYSDASKYFYRTTTPWDDRGWRLLAVDLYEDFTKKYKTYTGQYREKVNLFIDNIEAHMEEMKGILGQAYDVEDYKFVAPNGAVDREMLLSQFALEVEFDTVTSGNDLRASLTDADREIIAAEMDKRAMEKFSKSQEHIVIELVDVIDKMHERLSTADAVFRDTLVSNLEELCDLVPKMNIAGDQKLNDIARQAREKLTVWDAKTLRDDPKIREQVSAEANDILKQAKGLL